MTKLAPTPPENLWPAVLDLVRRLDAQPRPAEGPPPRDLPPDRQPLPSGWSKGLTDREVAAVLRIESTFPRVLERQHEKGYFRVALPKYHPYANKGGQQLLHRYVGMRQLGRRLKRCEHVHHKPGARMDSRDPRDYEVREEVDHAYYHRGAWQGCGPHLEICSVCGGNPEGCFNCLGGRSHPREGGPERLPPDEAALADREIAAPETTP